MENLGQQETVIDQAAEALFDFAVDREDVKTLLEYLPKEADVLRSKVEYELGILRIISVGWCISYLLEHSPYKNRLGEHYWKAVHAFSQSISGTVGLMIGQNVDYFQVLRDRLDTYIDAMRRNQDSSAPAVVIGPEFARACGNEDDVRAVMAGTKMFITTVGGVREYLATMGIVSG